MATTKLADLVRRHMKQAHLSQREMARRAGVSQGHLSKVLRGKTPTGTAVKQKILDVLPEHVALGASAPLPSERQLIATIRRLIRSSPTVMHFLADMMHSTERYLSETDSRRGSSRRQ